MTVERDPDVDLLRKVYAATQRPPSEDCPPPSALAALVLGEMPDDGRGRLADHVVSCRRCSQDARLLLETHRIASRELGLGNSSPARRLRLPLAAAAAIGLVAAGVLVVTRAGRPAESPVRGAGGTHDVAVSPRPGSALAEAPGELAWPPQSDAVAYRLTLFDAAGNALFESGRLQSPRLELPSDVRARLARGRQYFWSVEVEGPVETRRLGSFWFALSPP